MFHTGGDCAARHPLPLIIVLSFILSTFDKHDKVQFLAEPPVNLYRNEGCFWDAYVLLCSLTDSLDY